MLVLQVSFWLAYRAKSGEARFLQHPAACLDWGDARLRWPLASSKIDYKSKWLV